jgi:uncharacterized membrane protein
MIETLIALLGILFAFFIPGFLITLLFFEEENWHIKALFSVIISICFTAFLGLLLGFNEITKDITGGLAKTWHFMLLFCGLLLFMNIFKSVRKQKHMKKEKKK